MKYARPNKKEEIKVEPVPRQVHYVDVGHLSPNAALRELDNNMKIANTVFTAGLYNIGHTISNSAPETHCSNTVVHYNVTGNTHHYALGLTCIHRKK